MKIKGLVGCSLLLCSSLLVNSATAAITSGAFVEHNGWDTATIQQYNHDVVRDAASLHIFTSFRSDWNVLQHPADNVVAAGATPMISWMPYAEQGNDEGMLQEIVAGYRDQYIDDWIEGFRAWRESYGKRKPEILLRFGHEFNGVWYPWGNQPEHFKSAWQYLHARFEAAGVNDHISWVWCASATDVDDYNDITRYYPGDEVVDWVSLDGYNWGSNYAWTQWRSFDEVFSYQYAKLVSNYPDKPVILAELGSAEPHDLPDPEWGQYGDDSDAHESKEAWVSDMMDSLQTDYPSVKALVWFNINKELDWALNLHGNTGLEAYNAGLKSDYFVGKMPLKRKLSKLLKQKKRGKSQRNPGEGRGKKRDGLLRAMQVSSMPEVVGQTLLEREAKALKGMPRAQLRKWRLERLMK